MNDQSILKKAVKGGLSGSGAMVVQVTSLMWLRTVTNYQYRYGGTMGGTLVKLYKDGGVTRFYRGYTPALLIGPLSRFGDIAANTYVNSRFKETNTGVKTMIGSGTAALWRIALMPIDAFKTTLQVEGRQGLKQLQTKIRQQGVRVLFNGSTASMSATFVGHYPWFLTYNLLNENIPKYEGGWKLLRNGFIGFNAAVISDCVSNSLRVIKTAKQTYQTPVSYTAVVQEIVQKEGLPGLFGRGLKTKILTNGLQGFLFTICWKYIEEII